MKIRQRFIKSVVSTAHISDVQMPWTRSAQRKKLIANRDQVAKRPRHIR